MESYQAVRDKWRALLEQGQAGCCFDLDRLAPNRFCVAYSDVGGESMACYSEVKVLGFFDDAQDFLGFLRHAEIPRVLDYDTGINREPFPDVADGYLLDLEDEPRNKVDRILALIDRSLRSPMISGSELSTIRDEFNEAFSSTNPSVQILAWGSLADVLSSDHLEEEFEEAMVEEEEEDEDDRPGTMFKGLLDTGEFDENNDEHLALARGFLERLISV